MGGTASNDRFVYARSTWPFDKIDKLNQDKMHMLRSPCDGYIIHVYEGPPRDTYIALYGLDEGDPEDPQQSSVVSCSWILIETNTTNMMILNAQNYPGIELVDTVHVLRVLGQRSIDHKLNLPPDLRKPYSYAIPAVSALSAVRAARSRIAAGLSSAAASSSARLCSRLSRYHD